MTPTDEDKQPQPEPELPPLDPAKFDIADDEGPEDPALRVEWAKARMEERQRQRADETFLLKPEDLKRIARTPPPEIVPDLPKQEVPGKAFGDGGGKEPAPPRSVPEFANREPDRQIPYPIPLEELEKPPWRRPKPDEKATPAPAPPAPARPAPPKDIPRPVAPIPQSPTIAPKEPYREPDEQKRPERQQPPPLPGAKGPQQPAPPPLPQPPAWEGALDEVEWETSTPREKALRERQRRVQERARQRSGRDRTGTDGLSPGGMARQWDDTMSNFGFDGQQQPGADLTELTRKLDELLDIVKGLRDNPQPARFG